MSGPNGHNAEDPMSLVNFLDATMEAAHTVCDSCQLQVEVIPAAGTRFVLGLTHEPHCSGAAA